MTDSDIANCLNTHCPWSGKPVQADSLTEFKGHIVGFCNTGCRNKFEQAVNQFEELMAAEKSSRLLMHLADRQILFEVRAEGWIPVRGKSRLHGSIELKSRNRLGPMCVAAPMSGSRRTANSIANPWDTHPTCCLHSFNIGCGNLENIQQTRTGWSLSRAQTNLVVKTSIHLCCSSRGFSLYGWFKEEGKFKQVNNSLTNWP